jgi:fructose transport system permease protein
VSIIGILAAAQTLIILTAGIDLSVAAIMVLMTVIGQARVKIGMPAPLALLGPRLGTLAGLMNGLLVTLFRLPPFIVTLGTWNDLLRARPCGCRAPSRSAARTSTPGAAAEGLRHGIEVIGGAQFTYGSILMVMVFVVLWYMLNRTAWGRHVYAVGDDKEAAELAGIRTDRVLLSVYAVAGLVCAIAAWASIGRVGSVSPQSLLRGQPAGDHRRGDRRHLAVRRARLDHGRAVRGADRGRLPVRAQSLRRRRAVAGLRDRLADHHRGRHRPVDPEGVGMTRAMTLSCRPAA